MAKAKSRYGKGGAKNGGKGGGDGGAARNSSGAKRSRTGAAAKSAYIKSMTPQASPGTGTVAGGGGKK
jgi:hypothetical protein